MDISLIRRGREDRSVAGVPYGRRVDLMVKLTAFVVVEGNCSSILGGCVTMASFTATLGLWRLTLSARSLTPTGEEVMDG